MTKEEKIKEIYGNSFVLCSPDENGWSNVDEKLGGYEFLDNDIEYYDFECSNKWRPKSLSGIENNNDWIKLKGEANEILHVGDIWIISKHGNIEYIQSDVFLEIGYATHYQPIQKPEPQIY